MQKSHKGLRYHRAHEFTTREYLWLIHHKKKKRKVIMSHKVSIDKFGAFNFSDFTLSRVLSVWRAVFISKNSKELVNQESICFNKEIFVSDIFFKISCMKCTFKERGIIDSTFVCVTCLLTSRREYLPSSLLSLLGRGTLVPSRTQRGWIRSDTREEGERVQGE